MSRRDEIINYIKQNRPNDVVFLSKMVDDVVFLEKQLEDLRKLPVVEIHPTDPSKQRATPSAKLYKELLQQYNNCVKIILLKKSDDDGEDESPLRKYMKQRIETR